jgi:large subunit ribosomal protein L13
MKTYAPKPWHIDRRWYVLDAEGQVLGRLATEVATLLRGKHKPMFAPHMDTGDHVIVVNADKIELTGNKAEKKVAYRHSGHPGGIRAVRYADLLASRPAQAVEKAVRGMLPKNRLGRQMIGKLHVVAGPEHPHAAQKPVALSVGDRPRWDGLPAAPPAKPVRRAAEAAAPDASDGPKRTTASKQAPKKQAAKPTAKRSGAKSTTTKAPTAKKPAAKRSSGDRSSANSGTKKSASSKTATKKSTGKRSTSSTPSTAGKSEE